jgi:two-component system nitrogen regulation sensor histidine kinase NtrY
VARRVAHEIKNPLTALRYALHRVQRRAALVPEAERAAVQESLDAMLLELENLATMAEQFSQYARLPEPLLEPLDLTEVARAAAALHEPGAVRIDIGGGALPVRGDRLMLSRALHNLVINAREAGRDAPIEIRARAEGSRAVVEVLDRGPGLPPGQEGRIFDAYVSTKHRGSGLGLSLVRDIVRQHGGEVTLENREGGGACARLTLPLDQEDGREAGTP